MAARLNRNGLLKSPERFKVTKDMVEERNTSNGQVAV